MNQNAIATVADLTKVLHSNHSLSDQRIGDLLIQEENLTEVELEQALQWQQLHPGVHIGDILVNMGFCSREQVNAAMASKLASYVRLATTRYRYVLR